MTRRRQAVLALSVALACANVIVAAHAWRFTHFASEGAKTGNPEALSAAERIAVVGHRFEAMGLPAQPGAALLVFWGGVQLGFNGFELNPVDFAPNIQAPTLLLSGEDDPRVHLAEVESIRASLGGPSELVVFPSAGHVGLHSADAALWRSSVTSFLDRVAPIAMPASNSEHQRTTP